MPDFYSIADVGQSHCVAGVEGSPNKQWCSAAVGIAPCDCEARGAGKCLHINRPFHVLFLAISCAQPPCVRIADVEYDNFVSTYDVGTGVALSAQLKGYQNSEYASRSDQWFLYPNGYADYAFAPPAHAGQNTACIPVQEDSVVDLSNSELYENTMSKYTLADSPQEGGECSGLESMTHARGFNPPLWCNAWNSDAAACAMHYVSWEEGGEVVYAACTHERGACRIGSSRLSCDEPPACATTRHLVDTQGLFPAEWCNDDIQRQANAVVRLDACTDFFCSWTEEGQRYAAPCTHSPPTALEPGGSCRASDSWDKCAVYDPISFLI